MPTKLVYFTFPHQVSCVLVITDYIAARTATEANLARGDWHYGGLTRYLLCLTAVNIVNTKELSCGH